MPARIRPQPRRERFDASIAALAARRFGVFARAEAIQLGASSKMIRTRLEHGRWQRLHGGRVFCIGGCPPTWERNLMAAALAWGPEATVSRRAAAALWQVAGFDEGIVELDVPRSYGCAARGVLVHRTGAVPAIDLTHIGPIPVTTPARTLIDIAAVSPDALVEQAVDDALHRGLVTLGRLERRLGALGRQGRPGTALMRRIVAERRSETRSLESELERKLLRAIVADGLPKPVPQYRLRISGRKLRLDLAYPDLKIAIEADGYRWHGSRDRWRADLERRNVLAMAGWHVVHVTWDDLATNPGRVVETIRHIHHSRR